MTMFNMFERKEINETMNRLERHLKEENPLLVDVVGSFRELDRITRKIGFFDREESYAKRIPWWPVVSILGVYSAGKSAFINHILRGRWRTGWFFYVFQTAPLKSTKKKSQKLNSAL